MKKKKQNIDYYFTNKVKGITDNDRLDLRNLKWYPIWSLWQQIKFHFHLHNNRKLKNQKEGE